MKDKEIQKLIQKYFDDTATPEERKLLDTWYRKGEEENVVWDLKNENLLDVKNRIKANIWNKTVSQKKSNFFINRRTYAVVAAALLVVFFTLSIWYSKQNAFSTVAKVSDFQVENRHVILSDSTVVILRPGGELLVAEDFGQKERVVELLGDAYFDVKANKEKPFVIKTGKIKTTVLGTAFSIHANPESEDIKVLVDHGKVRVEKENELLAELVAHQKIIVNRNDVRKKELKVITDIKEAKSELAWKEQDMIFESLSFGELKERLERRYNVKIDFVNPALVTCKMSGAFLGTDNLEDVLTNLCLTSNTKFRKIAIDHFEIVGDKCFN